MWRGRARGVAHRRELGMVSWPTPLDITTRKSDTAPSRETKPTSARPVVPSIRADNDVTPCSSRTPRGMT
jgi:hypothetical protein